MNIEMAKDNSNIKETNAEKFEKLRFVKYDEETLKKYCGEKK